MVYQTQSADEVTEDKLCHFVTNVLPSVLEEKHGYRLFIHGRDDIPGEGQRLLFISWDTQRTTGTNKTTAQVNVLSWYEPQELASFVEHVPLWPRRPPGAGGGPDEAEQEADGHPHLRLRIRVRRHRPARHPTRQAGRRRVWLAGRRLKYKTQRSIVLLLILDWCTSSFSQGRVSYLYELLQSYVIMLWYVLL